MSEILLELFSEKDDKHVFEDEKGLRGLHVDLTVSLSHNVSELPTYKD